MSGRCTHIAECTRFLHPKNYKVFRSRFYVGTIDCCTQTTMLKTFVFCLLVLYVAAYRIVDDDDIWTLESSICTNPSYPDLASNGRCYANCPVGTTPSEAVCITAVRIIFFINFSSAHLHTTATVFFASKRRNILM